jgi:hypothetical protein
MAEKLIDKKYLAGLTYSGSKAKEVKEEGQPKRTIYIPFDRQAEPGDVLDWKDLGDSISVVMKDGKKYSVAKKSEK